MDATLEGHLHRRCGGHYAQAVETVTIRLSGMTAKVDRALFRCDKCGDVQHTVEQREAAEREAILTMRHDHGLLAAKEIRQFREALGLSAEHLGALLHGLPRGIVEGWEKGRYLQSPAVDALIRALADPEERERRAAKAGVTLPPLPGTEGGPPSGDSLPPWAAARAAAARAAQTPRTASAAVAEPTGRVVPPAPADHLADTVAAPVAAAVAAPDGEPADETQALTTE